MTSVTDSFWDFSIELYARKGVAEACLELQNSYGLDVNLLLFCFWWGYQHGELDEATLDKAIGFSDTWRTEVVQPLRNVRRWMKDTAAIFAEDRQSHYDALRERIKLDELAAEKYQQKVLEGLTADIGKNRNTPLSRSGSRKNLQNYLKHSGVMDNSRVLDLLRVIDDAIEMSAR